MEQSIVFGQGTAVTRPGERAAGVSDRAESGGTLRRVRDPGRPRSSSPVSFKQHQFPSQQILRGNSRTFEQKQSGQHQLGRFFTKSPEQQQYAQQQIGKGYGKSLDSQQFGQQQMGKGYTKTLDSQQFNQQQMGKGYARSPEQQQSSPQQVGKGNVKIPDQQQIASQQISKGFAKSSDQQREEEAAKARRLVRFRDDGKSSTVAPRQGNQVVHVERQPPKTSPTLSIGTPFESANKSLPIGSSNKREMSPLKRPDTMVEDSAETDGPENLTAEAILGVCPDMCPEIEREERERKGDLDRFERVEGDRNQTSVDLAVKKYTRTAEKDAVLIRPLPVLKRTMCYLLSLLERDHEDDLLSVHNFLWDRMRAVRMDLRMQHIFGEDAITMHEQMIRFHILAMHELCEYVQGEAGVSEGFNAHLNIEQMNKTSVDLFQMYEDHWKKGISVPSEAEFRGYYALLKLDKHPGYRVEPAELSLDLAKMSPEIRRSPQVLFARDVARACRGSNYVAFFRLARQATYLQACLMHAHFAKLRTQALASLHSALLKNQGIPLSTLVDWLGMEDIEALIKYHGFSIKYYEEPYIVKEGALLNKDRDFPNCRSEMVEAKRSAVIAEDVQSGGRLQIMPHAGSKLWKLESFGRNEGRERKSMMEGSSIPNVENSINTLIFNPISSFVDTVEEDMPDYVDEEEQPPMLTEIAPSPIVYRVPEMIKSPTDEEGKHRKKRRMEELQFEAEEHEKRRLRHEADAAAGRAARQALAAEAKRQEEKLRGAARKAEADFGKQLRWLRKWRRRAAAKALERQQKLERAEAALNTLSVGFPLLKMRIVGGDFLTLNDRHSYLEDLVEDQAVKLQEFWAPMNIPRLVLPILQELNSSSKFLYWNVLLSSGGSSAGNWVRTKISNKRLSKAEEEFASLADLDEVDIILADERKIFFHEAEGKSVGLWYSAREVSPRRCRPDFDESFHGTNGLIFVNRADESVTVEHARLHTLMQALPEGASVPLLVISTKIGYSSDTEAEQFSLQRSWDLFFKTDEVSHSKISEHKMIFIGISPEVSPDEKTYFSEEALVDGLLWLAKLSPPQPQLRPVLIADLVREHLNEHMKVLLKMPSPDVRPEHCVTVFNTALEQAADEITKTGSVIPLNWPPDPGSERKVLTTKEAWNHRNTLESLNAALQSCLLPEFPFVPSFDVGDDLFNQKSKLESVLLDYLSTLEGTSRDNPTTRWEVNRVVQRSCTVNWSKRGTKLVPKWARIFQALFSARLLLTENRASPVYVTRVDKSPPFELENYLMSCRSVSQVLDSPDSYDYAEPSLDDLIRLTAHEHMRRTQADDSKQGMRVPLQEIETPSRFSTPRRDASKFYEVFETPTPDTRTTPTKSRRESFEEIQRQDAASFASEYVAELLIVGTAFDAPKTLQLASTESESFLDDMMHELERWETNPGDYHGASESRMSRQASYDRDSIEIREYGGQGSFKTDDGRRDSARTHVTSEKKRRLNPMTFELDLTESEILLENLVAEFSSKTSEPNDVFTSNIVHCNGEVEHKIQYNQVLSSGSPVTPRIS